jgi:hypothetical protein
VESLEEISDHDEDDDSAEADDDDGEDSDIERRKEKYRIERANRNRENRASNRQQREEGLDNHDNRDAPSHRKDLSAYMPVNQRKKYQERVLRKPGNFATVETSNRAPNRSERRKHGREGSNTSIKVETSKEHAKINADEPNYKRAKMESETQPASVESTRFRAMSSNQAHILQTGKKANSDLNEFAVTGKEWKEVSMLYILCYHLYFA